MNLKKPLLQIKKKQKHRLSIPSLKGSGSEHWSTFLSKIDTTDKNTKYVKISKNLLSLLKSDVEKAKLKQMFKINHLYKGTFNTLIIPTSKSQLFLLKNGSVVLNNAIQLVYANNNFTVTEIYTSYIATLFTFEFPNKLKMYETFKEDKTFDLKSEPLLKYKNIKAGDIVNYDCVKQQSGGYIVKNMFLFVISNKNIYSKFVNFEVYDIINKESIVISSNIESKLI